jgi:hypothetical protein
MAEVADYIGCGFGSFEIERHVAHGAEAEVYCIRDFKHDRRLILRLDPKDDELWDGDPMVPPRNSSLEVRNAKGTWVAARNYRVRASVDKQEFKFACASIYGVLDQRFLIPVSARLRVENALSPDHVLGASAFESFSGRPLWEGIAIRLVVDTANLLEGKLSEDEWDEHWSRFATEPRLEFSRRRFLQNGVYAARQADIERIIAERTPEGLLPVFKNLLVRLAIARADGKVSEEQLVASMKCRHFRINVSNWEIGQLLELYSVIEHCNEISFPPETDVPKAIISILHGLSEQPLNEWDVHDEVVEHEKQPDLDRFSLFLQEYVVDNLPFPAVQRTKRS